MRVPVRSRRSAIEFSITPMIDMVFNMVIFFLVVSHFSRSESNLELPLPAASKTDEEEIPRRLTVEVTKEGKYWVNGAEEELARVEQLLSEQTATEAEGFELRIRADKNGTYEQIQPLLLAAGKAGVRQFGFAVIQE